MYEYLKGTVTFISPYYIVVENQGIGYQIALGNPYRYSSKMNQEITIYIQQVIREDGHLLYGFSSLEEKQLFLRLVSVSGIGPKSALAIMASDDHSGLIHAIESGDVTYLTKFPGVGKKTAQQMILDLKGKLGEISIEAPINLFDEANTQDTTALAEAMEALNALGYSAKEVKRVEKQLQAQDNLTTDEYLRQALKLMMKK
ncbi:MULTISPECIES: Holliday junction branch migration protein RuvA [Enterococcus]|uniref:Holliday junction branch migration complex subunit RuvA n=1 Tax=Enterococcus thailandicus TaxID=417368 RepID=A0A179ER69_ENTTH|nr:MULTISPECIES: Holliday junction branch migration protein RuvA [Enterococcus]ASZ06521.1 Holliday junction branch migration protein RuvA [Enterococcus thailandicus]MDA3974182.1 Holliday junction branch migration protein RuvA [Enterococcus thailandicus]MDA3976656.1 Holliday junction branch migration protein RuvA [Enterococcus thailandicus]MDA3981636.1 Holliday junction branch migration protein RuvA [Enterococcus thailandicus]MDK4353159.1 Holliday junction branch migration protein RuvA [Enteroc